MLPLISDSQFNSIALIVIAVITTVGAIVTGYWARGAKQTSAEANKNSAKALHEVQTNGGMSDPNPNLNDHIKYQTTMTEYLVRSHQEFKRDFNAHLQHSALMDQALAEVYLEIRPKAKDWPDEDLPQPPKD